MRDNIQPYYVAHYYFGEEEKPLSEEEEIAYVFYLSEKNRQKPGILRRKGERIDVIVRIYYPLIIKSFRNGYSLIFDPYKNLSHKLSYHIINYDKFEKILDGLSEVEEAKSFLDKLVYIENTVKKIVAHKEGIMRREVEIGPVILDQAVVNEIKTIINRNIEHEFPGVVLPFRDIDVDKYVEQINLLIDEISEAIGYITRFRSRLKKIIDDKLCKIEEKYSADIKELDEKIKKLREETNLKINKLLKDKDREIEEIRKHYNELITETSTRIKELEKFLEELKKKEERARKYGEKIDSIKRRKEEVMKELKKVKSLLETYRKRLEEEIREIELRYKKLIENERLRIKNLETEKERVMEELSTIKNEIFNRLETITNKLFEYIDEIKAVEKKIMDISIPSPNKGDGTYYITLYITLYVSEDTSRKELFTPVKIIPSKRLRSSRVHVLDNIRNYIETIKDKLFDPNIRSVFEDHNLLKKVPLERVEVGLSMLTNKKLVDPDEIEEVINSLRSQIEML